MNKKMKSLKLKRESLENEGLAIIYDLLIEMSGKIAVLEHERRNFEKSLPRLLNAAEAHVELQQTKFIALENEMLCLKEVFNGSEKSV